LNYAKKVIAGKRDIKRLIKEAQEMWKRPLSLEQAKKQVAEVKADMMKDKDRRTH
jgi:hypothetical protein